MQETQVPSLGLGRAPGEGNGNLLQYSCLENSMDREAWWATAHDVAKSLHDCATNISTFQGDVYESILY